MMSKRMRPIYGPSLEAEGSQSPNPRAWRARPRAALPSAMPRLAWATDIHLEFCGDGRVDQLLADIATAAPDALLLGGDIGQSRSVSRFLRRIEEALSCPIYFVLGNHDFYQGSISDVRAEVAEVTRGSPRLRWLRHEGAVALSEATALVGVDGWSDGRYGNYDTSPVVINDYLLI